MRGELLSTMRSIAHAVVSNTLKTKTGYVVSYNPDTYAVKVRLEPESKANESVGLPLVITNWIPILRMYGGNGWGMIAPPNADPNPPYGDMALILWPDGGHGVALIGFFNDVEQAFNPDPGPKPGELWFKHKSGSLVQILNDKSIRAIAASGAQLLLDENGDFTLQSDGGASVISSGGDVTMQSSGGGTVVCTGNQVEINS